MTFKTPSRLRLAGIAAGVLCALCLSFIAFDVALAEMARRAAHRAAEPTVNKGDTAWMLSATIFVLLMTIPGLALFYGGLVRTKNMLSVLMWVFYSVCIVTILWVVVGYSLAFTGGSTALVGGFSKAFLSGVTPDFEGRDLLGRRQHSRARLHLLPDDLRGDHARADRRLAGGAHEVLRHGAVPAAVAAAGLLPDRPHGVVLGRPGRDRRRRQGARRRGRRRRQDRRAGQARRGQRR